MKSLSLEDVKVLWESPDAMEVLVDHHTVKEVEAAAFGNHAAAAKHAIRAIDLRVYRDALRSYNESELAIELRPRQLDKSPIEDDRVTIDS